MTFADDIAALRARFHAARDRISADSKRAWNLSLADEVPAILFYDPARFGFDGRDVPLWILDAVTRREAHLLVQMNNQIVDVLGMLNDWQKDQFRTYGYTVLMMPEIDVKRLNRGRRQLEEEENRIRDSLDYFACAFLPAIEALCPTLEGKEHASVYSYMARKWPSLRALNNGQADVPASGDTADNPVLRHRFALFSEDGQRLKLKVRWKGNRSEMTGAQFRKILEAETRAFLRPAHGPIPSPEAVEGQLHSYMSLIAVLAKAKAHADLTFGRRPERVRQHADGVAKLAPNGPFEVKSDPGAFGKRALGHAEKAIGATWPEEFVQPPTLPPEMRLTPTELVLLAFLADIDPYVICAQHQLFVRYVWGAREYGADFFRGCDIRGEGFDAIRDLLSRPTLRPDSGPVDEIALALHRAIDVFKSVEI
ncbi:hypothetical protein ACEPPZ_11310 [Paracoccus yeei]|uniref:hypothetical protein n=1 Tax=Paracoccus yeei TaxID=147645 RepID=UPI0037D1F260